MVASKLPVTQDTLFQHIGRLTSEFGKGFDVTNLRNMRRFHQAFPIRETVSPELSRSRYSVLKDSQQLFASRYLTVLPSEEELQRVLGRERRKIEQQIKEQRGEYHA